MATYLELRGLFNDNDLLNKIDTAIVIAADALVSAPATPTTADKAWAAAVANNTRSESEKVLKFVLAKNKDISLSVINTSTDIAIQAQVDLVVPILVDALAGV